MGKEVPVPGIVITLAEPSATYRTQQFMEACAPLFLELVESAQAFHYTFSEGASGSLEVFSANSKGVMDFSGLYAVAQRHALLPSPLFCPRFTVTEALSPTPGFVYYDTANVIFYGDRFSVALNNEPNPFDGSGGIQMEAEIPHPVYTPYSLGSMTVTDAAGVRRDLTEGCSVKLVYFIYDENGQDTGFRLNILDNNLYLVCSSQTEGIEHIFRLCPDPVPDNRGEKTSQG